MRRLDNFDIKVLDSSMLKYDIRTFLNECLDVLDHNVAVIMEKECVAQDDDYWNCLEFFEDVVRIFEFMQQVKLINGRTYKAFNEDFDNIFDMLKSKVKIVEKDED